MKLMRPACLVIVAWVACAHIALALQSDAASTAMQGSSMEDTVGVSTITSVTFPQGMTFETTIDLPSADSQVDVVQLLYHIGTDPTLNLEIASPSEYTDHNGTVTITTFVDLASAFVPFGVDLRFRWELLLSNGDVVETTDETTQWMDTRFDWSVRTSDQVRLYTYDTSNAFADMMLTESQASIDELESRYSIDAIDPLSIWVYPNYQDFAGTMQGNSREAIAGVTYPGMDTILGVVPDGDDAEFGRVIPHEISHQVLFAATDNAYGPPPLWFDEGIATHTQIGGTGFYGQMVRHANENGTLFDIRSLEASFPFQPQQATLAYASSWSMITYIEATWGPEGIARLIDAFSQEHSSDEAIQSALGISYEELDQGWKAWISVHGYMPTLVA